MPRHGDALKNLPERSLAAETLGLLAVALVAAIGAYSQRPAYQHWDSLVYADLAKRSLLAPSLYSVHVLPNALHYLVVQGAMRLGIASSALHTMQVTNAVVVGLTAALILWLGRSRGLSVAASVGFCLLLVGMRAYWYYAGTADLYAFIVLVTVVAFFSATASLEAPTAWNTALAGVAGGLALLSWQPHGLLLVMVCCLAGMRLPGLARWARWVLGYGAAAGLTVLAGYALSVAAIGLRDGPAMVGWVRGYFGNAAWGNRMGLSTLPTVIRTSTGALLSDGYRSMPYVLAKAGTVCLLLVLTLGLLRSGLRGDRGQRGLAVTTIVWAIVMALASWWFDPASPKFWIVTWSVLLCTGMLVLAQSPDGPQERRLGNALVLGTGIALAGFNYVGGVHLSHVMPNLLLRSMPIWATHTRAPDLLIVDFDWMPYLRYYLDRTALLYPEMTADPTQVGPNTPLDQVLRQRIEQATRAGNGVYRMEVDCGSPAAATPHPWCSPPVKAVFDDLAWDHAFSFSDGSATVQVWRLSVRQQQVAWHSDRQTLRPETVWQ
jgi:hypothetical protein